MSRELFWRLFDGEVGTVVFDESDVEYISGSDWAPGTEVGTVDEFLEGKDLSKLILLESDAYRGTGCYEGWYKEGDKVYFLDIVSEGMVYEVIV